jgi:hypothetical protein
MLEPLAEIDTRAIPDVEDFSACGSALAQGLDVLALEGTHVVLFFALDLVADS